MNQQEHDEKDEQKDGNEQGLPPFQSLSILAHYLPSTESQAMLTAYKNAKTIAVSNTFP
jgi:hypothetical protein